VRSALLIAALAVPGLCEEADGTAAIDKKPASTKGFAGYYPVSTVTDHSMIDKDVLDIADLKSSWVEAKKIYENGKNSAKGTGLRNLKAFSSAFLDKSKQDEPMAKLGNAFWGRFDFGDALVSAALDGTDDAQFGNFNTGEMAKQEDVRMQMVKKGVAFTVVWLYALHEMESALDKYSKGKYDVASGAPYALDEAWVFYVGSIDDGTGSGQGPYSGAEKFAKKFGTYGYEMGTGGRSRVNAELLYQFTAMQRYLQTAGNDEVILQIAQCIRAQFKVPLIQGCLSYAHQASAESMTDSETVPKIKAEAWAFCSAILPSLHEVDPASAEAVKKTVSINTAGRPNWVIVKKAFSTVNINKMGIKCEDVGLLGSAGYNFDAYAISPPYEKAELKKCSDDNTLISTNKYADSSMCATLKMPRCGNGVVCSSSASLSAMSTFTFGSAVICLLSLYSSR